MIRASFVSVLLLSSNLFAQQTIQVDFGSAGFESKQTWNNVSDFSSTTIVLKNAFDETGQATSVAIKQENAWAGFNIKGSIATDLFPASATRDSFFVQRNRDAAAAIRIIGLDPKQTYDFRFFASRLEGKDKRTALYTIGRATTTLDAHNNNKRSVELKQMSPDKEGSILISIECAPNSEYGYLGVLEIKGEFAPANSALDAADSLHGPPFVVAKAWAIADANTGKMLWGMEENTVRDIASTTKMMTAWMVLQLAKENPKLLDEVVTISKRAAETGGSSAGIQQGERIPVKVLLYGLLLPSGNDAALALAEHCGHYFRDAKSKDQNKDNVAWFVDQMNRNAKQLKMIQTTYYDPHGNSKNSSTASDLVKLATQVMKNELMRNYVSTRFYRAELKMPNGRVRQVTWKNTNQLLGIQGYRGIKTGTTTGAGACLVSYGMRENQNAHENQLIVVVLGSARGDARYVDSRNLYRYAWQQLETKSVEQILLEQNRLEERRLQQSQLRQKGLDEKIPQAN